MRAFNVFLVEQRHTRVSTTYTKTYLDTVFDNDPNPVAIKRTLVARGEFPPNIYVKRARRYGTS